MKNVKHYWSACGAKKNRTFLMSSSTCIGCLERYARFLLSTDKYKVKSNRIVAQDCYRRIEEIREERKRNVYRKDFEEMVQN